MKNCNCVFCFDFACSLNGVFELFFKLRSVKSVFDWSWIGSNGGLKKFGSLYDFGADPVFAVIELKRGLDPV